jgi:hypothetical protein
LITTDDSERRRRIRRNALFLALVAIGVYVGFIILSVARARA